MPLPALADFFSAWAFFVAGSWGLTSIMAIHNFHVSHRHNLRSALYAIAAAVVFILAWYEGAVQHQDSRQSATEWGKIESGIAEIKSHTGSQPGATPDQIISAGAAKILEQDDRIRRLEGRLQDFESFQELVASGTDQKTAAEVSAARTNVSGAYHSGVILSTDHPNRMMAIHNSGYGDILVYPPRGWAMEGFQADQPLQINRGSTATFACRSKSVCIAY